MKCQALISKSDEPARLCNKPATWRVPEGLQVKECVVCDEHRAAFIEAASHFCHRDGWQMPVPIDDAEGA